MTPPNKDQIFIDSIKTCKGYIDRPFISAIILQDKTNTIRKYLNSFGIYQLALYLQELHSQVNHRRKDIHIDDYEDPNQREAQRRFTGSPILRDVHMGKLKLSTNKASYFVGNSDYGWSISAYTGTFTTDSGVTTSGATGEVGAAGQPVIEKYTNTKSILEED